MKITKGYTLSQIVDFIGDMKGETIDDYKALKFIINYNDFLKQPLKKEMFVNEIEKPEYLPSYLEKIKKHNEWVNEGVNIAKDRELINKWQEAEKKVIFKGWELNIDQRYLFKGESHIALYSDSEIRFYKNEDSFGVTIKTLANLFQATDGELELKNVEI